MVWPPGYLGVRRPFSNQEVNFEEAKSVNCGVGHDCRTGCTSRPQSGGGIFNFVNESLQNWTKLDFSVDLPSNSTFACGPGPFFSFCQIAPTLQAGGTTLYDISLTGPTPATGGLGNGVPFAINLNDFISPGTQNPAPNGSGGWLPDNTFSGRANDFSPEPSTWLLLVAGFGGISGWGLLKRKRTV